MFTKTDEQLFVKADGAADVLGADGMTHNRCLRKHTDQQMFKTTDGAADVFEPDNRNRWRHACPILLFAFQISVTPLLRALAKAYTPCTKEPSGLIRTDGKRPDGATLGPWARGKYIAWDFTAIHTCAASYLHLSSSVPGGAAEHAADRKRNKYATLPASHEFVPIAVETLGPSTVRVASSCWNLVVVELWCPAIQERLFSCFIDRRL